MASVTDPRNLTTSFDYDAVGRRTAIHRPDNSAVRFTYDKMGNMTVLTTPANVPHDFEYNAVNRNSAYDTPLSGSYVYSYDRDRRLTKISFPSGKSITRAYQDAQLASVTMPEGRVNYTYEPCGSTVTRDAAGNIATRTETVAGESHEYAYAYDNVGRLTQVTKDAAVVESYSYDGPHNARTAETNTLRGLTNRAYAYDDEDHLTSAGDASFTYDKDGFLTGKTVGGQTTGYTYSSRGELTKMDLPDGTVVEYVHDPLGRRIAKKVGGTVTEKYLWQGRTRLLAVYNGSGSLKQRFEYADARLPVAMTQGSARYFLVYDQVGSLRAVTDSSGSVVKTVDYDSFGNVIADSNDTLAVPFGFAGGLFDTDTGLTRFGFRDYDADVGKWTAKDPILFEGGDTDLYGYVVGDPVNGVDPEGKFVAILAAPAIAEALAGMVTGTIIGASVGQVLSDTFFAKAPDNAYDPNGPKAPGKPGEADGFKDPKGGENWVPNPNGRGYGWEADDGRVWVPTGPKAHGGPHWDVQNPKDKSDYENKRPKGCGPHMETEK